MNKNLKKTFIRPISHYNKLNDNQDGIDLTLGEGHFNSSFNAKIKAYEALLNNNTKYGDVAGDLSLRKLLIEKYYPSYNYEKEIIITNGSTQGFFSVILTIINKGDEVIILSPHYPVYENVVKLLGGIPIIVDTSTSNFKITPETLAKYISKKTKVLIINEPCNPTGITYSAVEKIELLKLFKNNKFFIVVDELYKLYTKEDFVSFSDLVFESKIRDQFIFINGLSKSHLMTGYRIGYVVSSQSINKELQKLNFLSVGCISNIMQQGAIGAIEDEEHSQFVSNYYLKNVEILKEALKDLNIDFVDSTGAYYIFVDISKFKMDCKEFCGKFNEQYNVSLLPGSLFGEYYYNYIRVSCCKDIKDIIKFINYFTSLFNNFSVKS